MLAFSYLSGFKRGGIGLSRRAGEVCNLICRSLFHYYSDHSTSSFLLSVCFLPCVLPSLCASSLYFISMLPSERGGEGRRGREGRRERESKNKLTYLLYFLKEERRRERERERVRESKNKQTCLVCFLKKKRERKQKKEERR